MWIGWPNLWRIASRWENQGSRSIALWKFREAVQLFGSIGGKGNLFAHSRCSTVTEGRSKGPVPSLITENFVSRRYLVRTGGRFPFLTRGEKSWLLCAERSVRHARPLPCIFPSRAKDRGWQRCQSLNRERYLSWPKIDVDFVDAELLTRGLTKIEWYIRTQWK